MNFNGNSRFGRILGSAFVAIVGLHACARRPEPTLNAMYITWCDTTPMRPVGRPVTVPTALPVSGFGTITGIVVQRETGDALQGAAVRLVSASGSVGRSHSERPTDERGGFTFDSVTPGRYQIRARHISEYQDSTVVEAVGGRLDTVRIAMRAYRCHGY